MAFLKSPNLGTIQMGVIFTRADFRIIKITDFDHNSNSQSDSDIWFETWREISYLYHPKIQSP